MSTISLAIYKTEAGVHTNPATPGLFQTHCDGGIAGMLKKSFAEVIIHWDAENLVWVEDLEYTPGESIIALKTINPCDDTVAYLDYGFNDFRIKQICCVDETEGEGFFIVTEDGDIIETEDGDGLITEG